MTTFEQIITEHNDRLVYIFAQQEPGTEQPLSQMSDILDEVDELNKETHARITEIFDESFLDLTKIEGEK